MKYSRVPNKSKRRRLVAPPRGVPRVRAARAPNWREKLAWAHKEKIGTVLSAAEVREFVEDFDALVKVLTDSRLLV